MLRQDPAKNRVKLDRGSKHTKVIDRKTGRVITTLPDTPSDYRSYANVLAKLNKARVFQKKGAMSPRSDRFALPAELQHDALYLLDLLGYKPVENGKGVNQGGALTQLARYMLEAAREMGILGGRNLNTYQNAVSNIIVRGNMAAPESIDLISRAVEIGMAQVTDQPRPVVETEPEPEVKHEDRFTLLGPKMAISPHSVEELPKVEYEEVGPLYEPSNNGHVNADSLHLRILAAILDPNTSREEAIELSVEVASLESSRK